MKISIFIEINHLESIYFSFIVCLQSSGFVNNPVVIARMG